METDNTKHLLPRRVRETRLPRFRLLLFSCIAVGVVAIAFYTALRAEPDPSLSVYLCDTSTQMVECGGLDDVTTCSNLVDPSTGQQLEGEVTCVRSACGYELAHGIDISVSGASDPLAESGTPTNVKSGFMIFWSMLPYALMVFLLLSLLFCWDTSTLSFVLLLAVTAAINEFIIKKIFSQHRPTGSCLYFKSYGMPSGHATTSVAMLGSILLETWVDRPNFGVARKCVISASAIFFLAVVPYSRVYLHDHFRQQVGVGAAEGLGMAGLWFALTYLVVRDRLDGWMDNACCKCFGLRNNYRNDEPYLPGWARERLCREAPAQDIEEEEVVGDVEMGER